MLSIGRIVYLLNSTYIQIQTRCLPVSREPITTGRITAPREHRSGSEHATNGLRMLDAPPLLVHGNSKNFTCRAE